MIAVAFVLVCMGAVVGVWSTAILTSANCGWRIPLVSGRPVALPGRLRVLRGVSVGLLIFSAIAASPVWGYWSVTLIVGGGIVPLPQLLQHNHEVAAGRQHAS